MVSPTLSPRLSGAEMALFTVYLIHEYEVAKQKKISRLRLSRTSVRRLGLRVNLRDAIECDWIEALSDWGWIAFPNGEEFGLVRSSAVSGWVGLATKRVSTMRKRLSRGDRSALDEMEAALAKDRPEEEDEDD